MLFLFAVFFLVTRETIARKKREMGEREAHMRNNNKYNDSMKKRHTDRQQRQQTGEATNTKCRNN